jgi:DNA-binding CsgD family transcriptional regulator
MNALSQHDYRSILDFLKEINNLETSEAFLNKVITGLQTIVEGDIVTCFESGPSQKDDVVCFSDPQFVKFYPAWLRVCHEHPGWDQLMSSNAGSWVGLSDYMSETVYHRTALYNEVWRYARIEDNLGTLSIISPKTVVAVSINRDRRTFKDRDRQALNLLQPHLMQAWRNSKCTAGLCQQIDSYAQTLEDCPEGIVILDGRNHVRHATARALRHIEKYFGILTADDRLPRMLHHWVCREGIKREESFETAPRRPWVIDHADGSTLTITCIPCREGFTLILQERSVAGDLSSLGLSRRESEVMLWVTRGKSNEEIALLLGMRLGTVKKHLEHIFDKLGVESRTAAAATALAEPMV